MYKIRHTRFIWSSTLLMILLLGACSTEKNARINRGYHNMTARYNGYFNAKELIKESLKTYSEGNKEDFSKILPVYIYPTEANASSMFPNMQKAIDKTARVITRHSMPNPEKNKNKKEEWCKWIDNNWLVMGQAHFYKREFEAAIEKFEYVYKTYKNEDIKYDAQIWLAKTYMQMGRMNEAYAVLKRLETDQSDAEEERKNKKKKSKNNENNPKKSNKKSPKKPTVTENKNVPFPQHLDQQLYAMLADYHIRKKEYDKGIEYLEKAIKITKKKRERARLTFILAQLYQEKGQYGIASEEFAKIPKLNPTYEMEFYSRINRALLYEGGDSRGIKAELMKLLRDQKNKEFFDQIYYALAELELKDNHIEEGKSLLRKSIEASVSNERQKGKTYLRLGNIAFAEADYLNAKMFYDSCLSVLPQDYPKYDEIRLRSESLTELVEHLTSYQLQDSLYRLGNLPERKKLEVIEEVLRREKEEEEKRKAAEEAKQNEITNTPNNSGQSGGWYFYNAQSKALGIAEFKKTWGTRKLEDNWRRVNKESISDEMLNIDPDSLANMANEKLEKRKQEMLDKIPSGPDALADCRKKMQYALYHAGVLYKTRFSQPALAIKEFKTLLQKFEAGEYILPANYQLYLLYFGTPEAKPYENTILTDYPESEYAQLIRNPNFQKDDEIKHEKESKAYALVYQNFQKANYDAVLTSCQEIIANQKDNDFMPQYFFMRAMVYGKLQQIDLLEKALSECAEKFPEHEIGKEASSILDYLRNKKSKENPTGAGYLYEAETDHYFILVFPNALGSIIQAKASFSDFNTLYFSNKNLTVDSKFLDLETQVVLIKGLVNKKAAMEYYYAFKNENDKLKAYKAATCFGITSKNFAHFYLEKKIDVYLEFFKENYLN